MQRIRQQQGEPGAWLGVVGVVEPVEARLSEEEEWSPFTKLGHLVKDMKIRSLEEIYVFSLLIKGSEIVDFILGASFQDEVLKIMPYKSRPMLARGLQWTSGFGCEVVQGGSHCHLWGHHPGQALQRV